MTIAVSFCQLNMLYAERHRPRGVGLAGAGRRTWAVAEKNDWQFSNPIIDTGRARWPGLGDACQSGKMVSDTVELIIFRIKNFA